MVTGRGPLRPAGQGRQVVTGEEQVVPGKRMNGREENVLPVAPEPGTCRHGFPRRRHLHPEKISAAPSSPLVLFPDREPDLAIVAEARHSNVHILRSPDIPDGPTRVDRRCEQGLQALNIGALGSRRRSRWATPPGAGSAIPNDRQAAPGRRTNPPLTPSSVPRGPTSQGPSLMDASNPHIPIP